jgi:flagellar P-ring protein FlgI
MDVLMKLQKTISNIYSNVSHSMFWAIALTAIFVIQINTSCAAVRLKELTEFKGAEARDLIGYGIVVGLEGTGDGNRSQFTLRSVENMLKRFGITLDPGQIKPKNVAAVMITATLPAFADAGDRIDVTVSSLGDASSLMGGVLLMTPLTDKGGEVILARAQGPISIGGFNFAAGGSSIRKNYTLVGRVPGGAIVEKGNNASIIFDGAIILGLKTDDFTNARRVSETINKAFGENIATALNAGQVEVRLPVEYSDDSKLVEMASIIEGLEIEPDMAARVIINERTGTIVIGNNVRLSPVAVAHGNLSVIIKSQQNSQSDAFSGFSSTEQQNDITVSSEEAHLIMLEDMADVNGVARALNTLGVSPRDIISIFQLLKEAGALQADLVII